MRCSKTIFGVVALLISWTGQAQSDGDPIIEFFTAGQEQVQRFQQVALYWKIDGEHLTAKLMGIHGQERDVTGRTSYLTPPLVQKGVVPITLVVTAADGELISQTLLITVSDEEHTALSVLTSWERVTESTGTLNFSVHLGDESASWELMASGNEVLFLPESGELPKGGGDIDVWFEVQKPFVEDYVSISFQLTPQISDGHVELVTLDLTAPIREPIELSRVFYNPVDNEDAARKSGILRFAVDHMQSAAEWSIEIIGGDLNGRLNGIPNRVEGVLDPNGLRSVWCHYQADRESNEPVLFLIRVQEEGIDHETMDAMVFKLD